MATVRWLAVKDGWLQRLPARAGMAGRLRQLPSPLTLTSLAGLGQLVFRLTSHGWLPERDLHPPPSLEIHPTKSLTTRLNHDQGDDL